MRIIDTELVNAPERKINATEATRSLLAPRPHTHERSRLKSGRFLGVLAVTASLAMASVVQPNAVAVAEVLPDVTPPVTSEATIKPGILVKASNEVRAEVSYRLTDESGARLSGRMGDIQARPSNFGTAGVIGCEPQLLSGTDRDGIWGCTLDFTGVNALGVWDVSSWPRCDILGNCGSFQDLGEVAVYADQLTNVQVPTIEGEARVGKTLTAFTGTWSHELTSARFQWNRNGVPINYTGTHYIIQPEDLGQELTVTITGYRSVGTESYFYLPGSSTSGAIVPSEGKTVSGRATILGVPKIGSELTVHLEGWGVEGFLPSGSSGLKYAFQWLRDGKPIEAANGSSYVVSADNAETSISVEVTAAAPGFAPTSAVSGALQIDRAPAEVSRLAGPDRFATSVEISQANFAPGVPVVYIASGQNFPDALSGAGVAAKLGGPTLLVTSSSVPSVVAAELQRLKPKKVVILGSDSTISTETEAGLRASVE